MFVVFCIQDQGSNNFENDIIKLSVNKAKLIGLWAINCDTIQQVLIFKFALRPEEIFRPFEKRASEPNHRRRLKRLGSFSIDDGNGRENITFNMNSRFFKLCRVYSNLLKMTSVGEFPWI